MSKVADSLYVAAKAEFDAFADSLSKQSPREIIDSAYEITIKREFLSIVENEELQPDTVNRLSQHPNPLACLYDEWLSNDYSFQDVLHDTMQDWREKETVFADDNSFDYSEDEADEDMEQ